jgi:hypothetical protein
VLGIRICAGGQAREFVEHEPGVRDPDRVADVRYVEAIRAAARVHATVSTPGS